MAITIGQRKVGDVVILDIDGRITLGQGSSDLRDTIRDLIKDGCRKVILNLAATSYVDSSGIGQLVSSFTELSNLGAQLRLLYLTERVKGLMQTTKLYTCFEIYHDEGEALKSFNERKGGRA